MTPIYLFLEFFQIGVFSFGGGYATLPFLYHIADKYNWYTPVELSNMLAISSLTPGPVGINVATFAGFSSLGILGAIIATSAIIIPSYLITSAVYKIINKFKTNIFIKNIISSLKACGCALLTYVGIKLIFTSNLNLIGIIILLTLIITSFYKKLTPLCYLSITAVIGLILGYFHLIGV